jgi:hypothetical protein
MRRFNVHFRTGSFRLNHMCTLPVRFGKHLRCAGYREYYTLVKKVQNSQEGRAGLPERHHLP